MLKVVFVLLLIAHAGCSSDPKRDPLFDRVKWIEDFDYLEKSMSEAYPNFDVSEANHINLPELDKATRQKLISSNSTSESSDILEAFVKQFKDGHFRLEKNHDWPAANLEQAASLPTSLTGSEACQKLMDAGYKNFDFQFPTPAVMGFTTPQIHGHAFLTTTLKLGEQKIGFLRISSFGQGNYPDLCSEEWEKFRKSGLTCDGKCQNTFVYRTLPNRLLVELEKSISSLKKAKVSSLVVDLTGNGSGTDWVSAVIRELTEKPILCGQFGFIKHPHWAKHFRAEAEELRKKKLLQTPRSELSLETEKKLQDAETNLQKASLSCDRSNIWVDAQGPTCSLVVKKDVLDCRPSDEFRFHKGLFNKPLYVLADHKTASAAEDMVSRYKESGAAVILGERTRGAGCGYVDDPIPFELPNSKFKVIMPNCVRYSQQGLNEVLGIEPDVVLPVQDLKSEAFTRSLVEYLKGHH